MSTYKDISELNAAFSSGTESVQESVRQLRVRSIVPPASIPSLELDPSVHPPVDITGAGLAEGDWTTMGRGLDNGEVIKFNRAGVLLSVASTDASDTAAGAGARQVLIVYIDMTGDVQQAMTALNGTTEVALGVVAQAVNSVLVLDTGSTDPQTSYNLGRIYVGPTSAGEGGTGADWSSGKPDDIWGVVEIESCLSRLAFYMIPLDSCGIIGEVAMTSDAEKKDDDLELRVWSMEKDPVSGSELSLRVQDYRFIGNHTFEGRGIACLLPLTALTIQYRSDRNGGVDCSVSMALYHVPIADYPNAGA